MSRRHPWISRELHGLGENWRMQRRKVRTTVIKWRLWPFWNARLKLWFVLLLIVVVQAMIFIWFCLRYLNNWNSDFEWDSYLSINETIRPMRRLAFWRFICLELDKKNGLFTEWFFECLWNPTWVVFSKVLSQSYVKWKNWVFSKKKIGFFPRKSWRHLQQKYVNSPAKLSTLLADFGAEFHRITSSQWFFFSFHALSLNRNPSWR